jgi:hypothetical protein
MTHDCPKDFERIGDIFMGHTDTCWERCKCGNIREVPIASATTKELLIRAAALIETLLLDPEDGSCQMCGTWDWEAHKSDCEAKLLIERLKAVAEDEADHARIVQLEAENKRLREQLATELVYRSS